MKHFYFSWKKSRLQKKLETFRELIQIMNYTQTGHTVLNQFEEFNKTLDIKVEFKPYPREIITKINSANGDMRPVGASFVTNGKSGVIYFDYRNELGILALQFIHEMVHAMDLNLWSLAKELQAGKTENKSDLI